MICEHINWACQINNLIGTAYCLDCNKEVNLAILINGDHSRTLNATTKLNKLLKEA